jgi:hypothetical protein
VSVMESASDVSVCSKHVGIPSAPTIRRLARIGDD